VDLNSPGRTPWGAGHEEEACFARTRAAAAVSWSSLTRGRGRPLGPTGQRHRAREGGERAGGGLGRKASWAAVSWAGCKRECGLLGCRAGAGQSSCWAGLRRRGCWAVKLLR
jgi:hypothetical protein